jgi:hypothetical protein
MNDSVNVDFEPSQKSALDRYLEVKKSLYLEFSGDEIGLKDIMHLKADIEKTVSRTKRFFEDKGMKRDSQLVIGKVQSGKTAHLLGVIAALVDSRCSLCVVISGTTGALNRQTKNRLEDDLGGLDSHPVSIHPLPTQKTLRKTNVLTEVKDKVKLRIQAQRSGKYLRIPSLPVVALLESKQRIEALDELVREFRQEFGEDFIIVIIDDEADQASQNTLTSVNKESEIFKVIKRIRDSDARNYLISYTATPHAILMTEKEGALRPRLCSVSISGFQYFGLENVMESENSYNRVRISDTPTVNQIEPPKSLRSAILKFLIKGLILREAPEVFFGSQKILEGISIDKGLRTSQMLVHPSSRVGIHDDYFVWINEKILGELKRLLGNGSFEPDPDFVNGELDLSYTELKREIGEVGNGLPPHLPEQWVINLGISVTNSTKTLVVNSSPTRKTTDIDMPSDGRGWNRYENWILIGGDILGRGVTIPHLTTTYFLRNPKNPQFDTLSQQMRFCGYRSRYSSFVSIYAPVDVFVQFEDLLDIDSVLHSMAKKWDAENTDLLDDPPGLCFVKRAGSQIVPTRRGVIDPSVKMEHVGRTVFQSSSYANPVLARKNSEIFTKFLNGTSTVDFSSENWQSLEDISHRSVRDLVNELKYEGKDIRNHKKIDILLDEVLGKFSLLDAPISIVTRNLDLLKAMSLGQSLGSFSKDGIPFRGSLSHEINASDDALREIWNRGYEIPTEIMKREWYNTLDFVPLVGDSERTQQDQLAVEGSMLLVAPYALVVRRQNRPISSPIGYGVGIVFRGPSGREITIEGF